jgi:hypothetical protein
MLPRAKWEIVRISPETISAVEAGEQGLEFIAVGSDRPGERRTAHGGYTTGVALNVPAC